MSLLDQAKAVREGEELDIHTLKQYLSQQLEDFDPDHSDLTIEQFPGGASNLTYLLKTEKQSFILRRPPIGKKAKSAHDMQREYQVMAALKPNYPYVPNMIAFCEDPVVMGSDFYIMERLEGIILRKSWPKDLAMSKDEVRQLCFTFIDKLIALHQLDYQQAGLSNIGKGSGYVKRQIEGWSDRYIKASTDDAADCSLLMDWLKQNMPEDKKICLVHNDFRLDNVVLDPNNPQSIIGVLDWEMATLGDPLMDLGNSLAYWIQADDEAQFQIMRQQCSHVEGMLTRDEVVEYYLEKTGIECADFTFYEIYGLFRLIVILQQIYYRYYHGQTKDKRFAQFIYAAQYLNQRCLNIIKDKG